MKFITSMLATATLISSAFAVPTFRGQCTSVCAEVLPKCLSRFDSTHCSDQHAKCLAYCTTTASPPYLTDGGATIIFPPAFGGPPPPPAALEPRAPTGLCGETCGQVLLACLQKNGFDDLGCKQQHADCLVFCGGHPEIPPVVSTDGTVITIHPPMDPPTAVKARDHVCSDLCPEVLDACLWNPPEGTSDEFCDQQDHSCRQWCGEHPSDHPTTSHNGTVIDFLDPAFQVKPFTTPISTATLPTPFVPTTETHTPPAPVKRQSELCQEFCTSACNESRALCLKRGVDAAICEKEYPVCFPYCYDTWCGIIG